ncbi:MAG: hypothetical protein M0P39_00520 [Rhodocyclaceae bacterium]|nr:hypothetical protein [Rhodocyclaceae bacterium]
MGPNPSIGSCTFDSGGERRLAERLEAKLEDDYLCWYNVALGPSSLHPELAPQEAKLLYAAMTRATRELDCAESEPEQAPSCPF